MSAPTHDEASRLRALYALNILDTQPECTFDEAAQMAATICGTPTALVNLLDRDRQWFKARVGCGCTEMPRERAFCNDAIGQTTPLVVPDAAADHRFADNPFVIGEPNLRFYAGMPLNTVDGHTIGTLCVTDIVPHELTAAQIEALSALGRQVAAQIELRSKLQLLAEVLAEKENVERALRERSLLFTAFMDHSPMIGFIKDEEGRFLYYNRMFCERFAVSPTEWLGKSVFDLFPPEFAGSYHLLDMAVMQSGVPQTVDEISPGPENTTLYWRTHKFRIGDGSGPRLLGGLSLDKSAEREAAQKLEVSHAQLEVANQQLTELSITDALTGLRNRRGFDEQLAREFANDVPLSLMLMDIDYFKRLNDSFGHSSGDDILRTIAKLMQESSRCYDLVARYGGEEFAVLLPHTDAAQALEIAERLRRRIETFGWPQSAITASIGVATRIPGAGDEAELIEAADTALYCAKARGRNCVEAANADAFRLLHECTAMVSAPA